MSELLYGIQKISRQPCWSQSLRKEDEMQCPNRGSVHVEPYDLAPDGPVDNPFEDEEDPRMG